MINQCGQILALRVVNNNQHGCLSIPSGANHKPAWPVIGTEYIIITIALLAIGTEYIIITIALLAIGT